MPVLFVLADEAPLLSPGGRLKGFLIDENLPRRFTLTPSLPVTLSDALGVSPTDTVLWQHARTHSLAIVTKDADFSHPSCFPRRRRGLSTSASGTCAAMTFMPCSPGCGRTSTVRSEIHHRGRVALPTFEQFSKQRSAS